MNLGRHECEILVGEATVFIAPAGTPPPALDDPEGVFDERWALLHPAVPDVVPSDLERCD